MRHRLVLALAALLFSLASAQAGIVVTVNKSTQRLAVTVNGETRYVWPTSTGRIGYNTPNGTYGVERMERTWHSRKYDWSPMPYSIFFHGGYAIHGSYEVSRLGRPASHGCIRLHPRNAAVLFNLVKKNRGATRIVVTGDRPAPLVAQSRRAPRYAEDVRPRRDYDRPRSRRWRNFEEAFDDPPYRDARRRYNDDWDYYQR
jgi:hypothetical protein